MTICPVPQVENLVVGAPCGIMDQMAAACGEAYKLLAMVCQVCYQHSQILNYLFLAHDAILFYWKILDDSYFCLLPTDISFV